MHIRIALYTEYSNIRSKLNERIFVLKEYSFETNNRLKRIIVWKQMFVNYILMDHILYFFIKRLELQSGLIIINLRIQLYC